MCSRQIQDHSPYLQNMFNLVHDYEVILNFSDAELGKLFLSYVWVYTLFHGTKSGGCNTLQDK